MIIFDEADSSTISSSSLSSVLQQQKRAGHENRSEGGASEFYEDFSDLNLWRSGSLQSRHSTPRVEDAGAPHFGLS